MQAKDVATIIALMLGPQSWQHSHCGVPCTVGPPKACTLLASCTRNPKERDLNHIPLLSKSIRGLEGIPPEPRVSFSPLEPRPSPPQAGAFPLRN
jgi:hypothetical protein